MRLQAAVKTTVVELSCEPPYEPRDWGPEGETRLTDAIYEPYALQSIRIPGAPTHPSDLVQSAAMGSVAPPKPSYRPHLPETTVSDGLLSDAQLESVAQSPAAMSRSSPA
jgi:hypothetical protein